MREYLESFNSNDIALGLLRVFIGAALLLKGLNFMFNMHELYDLTAQTLPFSSLMIAHYIVFAHVIGGFCLMIGLLTRTAALSNLPVILGAIFFVHAQEGLFSSGQGLELTIMLAMILCVFGYAKSKFLSVDFYLDQRIEQPKRKSLVGNFI